MLDLLYNAVVSCFDNPLDGDLAFTILVGGAATGLVAWMVSDAIKVLRS